MRIHVHVYICRGSGIHSQASTAVSPGFPSTSIGIQFIAKCWSLLFSLSPSFLSFSRLYPLYFPIISYQHIYRMNETADYTSPNTGSVTAILGVTLTLTMAMIAVVVARSFVRITGGVRLVDWAHLLACVREYMYIRVPWMGQVTDSNHHSYFRPQFQWRR